ncbi:MAG: glycosyltransferase [Rhodospirillaceae bacterium]|nr:glycosyltransferase [Rhodospirillaceae bacterium]
MAKATAIILKGYPRLSETFIAQEIRELEKHGLPLQIVSLRHPTDTKTHPIHAEITAPVSYLPEYLYQEIGRVWRAWRQVRGWASYQKVYQLWKRDLARDRSFNRVRRFGQALVLAAELSDNIEHLHAHFLHTPSSVTRYAAILKGLPWSCSAHAIDIWTTPEWDLRDKLKECSWAVTCTEVNQSYLASITEQKNKVTLAYHGIDLQRFPARQIDYSDRNGANADDPVRILSVGRAVEKKGYADLLAALALLPKDLNWHLVHVGGGPLINKLKRAAAGWGIADRITWLGSQSQEEVTVQYQEADFFVLASLVAGNGDRDGLPNVLMEAQSQGLACLSTIVSAIPELIENEATGLLVEPSNIKMLAEKLTVLIQNPQHRAKLGEAGAENVRTSFDFKSCMTKLYPLFDLAAERPQNKDVDQVA